jgi:hypothetical protein
MMVTTAIIILYMEIIAKTIPPHTYSPWGPHLHGQVLAHARGHLRVHLTPPHVDGRYARLLDLLGQARANENDVLSNVFVASLAERQVGSTTR